MYMSLDKFEKTLSWTKNAEDYECRDNIYIKYESNIVAMQNNVITYSHRGRCAPWQTFLLMSEFSGSLKIDF